MSLATVLTRSQWGIDAPLVHVEVHLGAGLPAFQLVGLADAGVRESRERVRAAIEQTGLRFPAGRLTVNLAPAEFPKEGGHYDLPLALGILAAAGEFAPSRLSGIEFYGELALDGTLRPESGLLVAAARAAAAGHKLVVPEPSLPSVLTVPGLEAAGARHLRDVLAHCREEEQLPFQTGRSTAAAALRLADLAEVAGQHLARQALEVAAAGGHSLLLVGPPGTGKTLLADRLPGLLPPLTPEQSLESALVHAAAGVPPPPAGIRPMRAPHHTARAAALVGGGQPPRPGEISLAHQGVLFLDELTEYPRQVLDALREPLESRRVALARGRWHVTFPANCQLVAAMNPCPCGYYPDRSRCRCGEGEVRRYQGRVSGPFRDRLDLQVALSRLPSGTGNGGAGESTAQVRTRVLAARERQLARGSLNAQLAGAELAERALLSPDATALLERTAERWGLSVRACHRVQRVARTVADLAGREDVAGDDVAFALRLREAEVALRGPPLPSSPRGADGGNTITSPVTSR